MTAHTCPTWPCPICNPNQLVPAYVHHQVLSPTQGCICPPRSEETCRNPKCPRGVNAP